MKQDLRKQLPETRRRNKALCGILVGFVIALAVAGYFIYIGQRSGTPQKLLECATRQENQQQFLPARETYQKIVDKYPQSLQAEDALYRIGQLWQYDLDDERQALLSYLTLEHDYPHSRWLFQAREETARIFKYSLRDYSRAIVYYQQLYQSAGPSAATYLFEIADCYFHLENYPQARIELESLLETFPKTDMAAASLYRIGILSLLEKHYSAAQQNWQKLIAEYPQSRYRLQAEFKLAEILEEQGELDRALKKFSQIEGYPHPALLQSRIEHLRQRINKKEKVN